MDYEAIDRIEATALGGMLRCNDLIGDAALLLGVEDFRHDAHRRVFLAARALWDAGKPVDLVSLAEDLRLRNWLEDVGGPSYLAKLWEVAATPAATPYHLRTVRDRSIVRRLHTAGTDIAALAASGDGDPEALVADAERRVYEIAEVGYAGGAVPIGEEVPRVFRRIDEGDGPSGLASGFDGLDILTGGFRPSELIVLAARPAVGKTSWAVQVGNHVAVERGQCVLFASLEMSLSELTERALCVLAGVDLSDLRSRRLSPEDGRRLMDAGHRLADAPLLIDDAPQQRLSRITATGRRLKRQKGLRLIVLDYLQLVEPDDRRAPRHEQVGSISRRLKGLAKELGVPVLALAQLNRASEDRADGRPRLSDLRESGSIEADADAVLLLHRPDPKSDIVEADLAKNRNGPTGGFRLLFRREYTRFEPAA